MTFNRPCGDHGVWKWEHDDDFLGDGAGRENGAGEERLQVHQAAKSLEREEGWIASANGALEAFMYVQFDARCDQNLVVV